MLGVSSVQHHPSVRIPRQNGTKIASNEESFAGTRDDPEESRLMVLGSLRRKTSRRPKQDDTKRLSIDRPQFVKQRFIRSDSDLTGWQKHLPQEKDDRTITKAFWSIFEQIQIHIEGFYESTTEVVPDTAIDALE
jgi:hypothetical protein